MKCEVWWAKWKLFHFEIYAFWTISTVSKQVGRGRAWSHFKWNTHSHADISDKALWSASNQTDCKYFETITSSEFISSTQVCFKRHSAKCLYVANVQSPLREFQLERKYSQSKYNHFGSCQFWPPSNFVRCNENLSQQVAIILCKLRRFSRLNFQWLQSKLNLAIVSLFLEDFCRIFWRNNNIRV